MTGEIIKITLNYLLVMIGSVSAGLAAYRLTGDPTTGLLVFGVAIGLVGAII